MAFTAAKLLSRSKPVQVPGKLLVTELWFEVPLDYSKPDGKKIKLFGRTAVRYNKPIVEVPPDDPSHQRPFLLFLQGGPGLNNPAPQDSTVTAYMVDRGYEILFLDYRGVGLSTTVSANTLELVGGPKEQAEYLKLFRADTIVKDSEAVRQCLTKDYPTEKKKWTIFGQSFGGMTCLTYLSFRPEGLREVFITGGLAGLTTSPEDIYNITFHRVVERNRAYYAKYPDDVESVRWIVNKIREFGGKDGILLPNGGRMTVQRFLTVGISLGAHGGIDEVHNLMVRLKADFDQFNLLTRTTLHALEQDTWDTAPIYTLLHEPCWAYGPGVAGNWAAYRVGKAMESFSWLRDDWVGPSADQPVYFSGEMTYPFLFDTCSGLFKLKETAQILAEFDGWPDLYNADQLARNEVPVYVAIYNDMYVDAGMCRETASKIKNIKTFETNVLFHSALRGKPEDVFRELLRLRDDTID